MPRSCTICLHPDRDKIDVALLEKESFRNIADRFGTSRSALVRHGESHIPELLLKAREAGEISKADDLIRQVESLQVTARQILKKAELSGDLRTALNGVRELARLIELVARMTDQIKASQVTIVNVELVDAATAEHMAEIFLERRRKVLS